MPKTEAERKAHADYMREYYRKRFAADPEYKRQRTAKQSARKRLRKMDPAYKGRLAQQQSEYQKRQLRSPEFTEWRKRPQNVAANKAYKRLYARKRHLEPEYQARECVNRKRNRQRSSGVVEIEVQKRKEAGCALCCEPDPAALSFHHLDPSTKRFTIAEHRWSGYSLSTMKAEMDKCIVICENCHRKIHANIICLIQ